MAFRFWLIFLCFGPDLSALAFVHVSSEKPKLPVTVDAPEIEFYWDGSVPKLKEKSFKGGPDANLDDRAFVLQLLQNAFQVWNEVPGSYLAMVPIEDASASIDAEDGRNSIVVAGLDSLSTAAFAQPYSRSTKDEAEQTSFEADPGIIHDCDITIADTEVDAQSLYSILIHEIGHCVGLGHPHTNYNSIMSYSREQGATSLGLDDVAGTIFLYPRDEQDVQEVIQCGSLGSTSGASGRWFLLLPLLLVLAKPSFGRWRREPS